jgi:hypothetical protein
MADNWVRVANTTIANYIRQEEVNVLRARKLLSSLQSRGRVTMNHSGTEMDWKVRYRQSPMQGYADGDTLSFPRQNRHKTAKLPWRGYTAQDSISKMEIEQNKGSEAIIKLIDNLAKFLMEDMSEQFGQQLYVDGNASGYTKGIHGLESAFGVSGAASDGYIGTPSDTYADLNTGLGYYGGSWTLNSSNSTWPRNVGSAEYDFWSPLIVDYTDTAWAASTKTWPNTCIEVLRFAITHAGRNKDRKGTMDMFLLDKELYRKLLDAEETKQQIRIQRGEKVGLVALGFNDVINFDGVDVTSEFGIPANVGYGLTIDAMELCSLQNSLFKADTPDPEISTRTLRYAIDMLGNMKFNPRSFVKLAAVT